MRLPKRRKGKPRARNFKMSPVNVTAEYDQTLNGRSAGQGGMTTCNASVIPVSFVWGYSNSFFTELDYSIFFEDD